MAFHHPQPLTIFIDIVKICTVRITRKIKKVDGMDNRLQAVEGTQKNQVWALIVLLGGAIVTAGARFFFTANPLSPIFN
ncbi:MAG: hypothetical protein WBM62_19565 [Crocosphaera sp.]|jgi:hypothetical protein